MAKAEHAATIVRLDHLVLTCADLEATASFYTRVMGFRREERDGRSALHFGQQKINLHQRGSEIEPHARVPTPGSADLCFVTESATAVWLERLLAEGVVLVEGPVIRHGALGAMQSIYFRDPDGNLIEVTRYDDPAEDRS